MTSSIQAQEKGTALAKRIVDTIVLARAQSERTQQSKARRLGMSDLGGCREYIRATIAGEPKATESKMKWAAEVGTAVGDHVERILHEYAGLDVQEVVVLTLPRTGVEVTGHLDEVDVEGDLIADNKGLAIDTPIPTPVGWTTMGEVAVGDQVLDMHGNPASVVLVSDEKHIGCYEVAYPDGSTITCDENHIWWARIGVHGELCEYPVKDLVGRRDVYIPVGDAFQLPSTPLPVDPWVLGYWLGNGSSSSPTVTAHVDDADEVAHNLTALGFRATMRRDPRARATSISVTTPDWRTAPDRTLRAGLRSAGVLGAGGKRVPTEYLRASLEQRTALLRGLLDSDGCWNRARNTVVFSSTSVDLARGVAELARTLGERPVLSTARFVGYGKAGVVYHVDWTPTFVPFSLRRKASRVSLAHSERRSFNAGHHHVRITPTKSVTTRCFSVDSPTKSYRAGLVMSPTHNTVDGLATVIREGPSFKNKVQISGYLMAAVQAGRLTDQATGHLVYFDRSGKEAEPHVWSTTLEQAKLIVDAAEERLLDVQHALATGTRNGRDGKLMTDEPRSWCEAVKCPFREACWAGYAPTGKVDHPRQLDAVRRLVEARAAVKEATALRDAARQDLLGVEGVVETGPLKGTVVEWTLRETSSGRVSETLNVRVPGE